MNHQNEFRLPAGSKWIFIIGSIAILAGVIVLPLLAVFTLGDFMEKGSAGPSPMEADEVSSIFSGFALIGILGGAFFWGGIILIAIELFRSGLFLHWMRLLSGSFSGRTSGDLAAGAHDIENRPQQLRELREKGLISEQEFTQQRAKIVEGL